MDKACCTVLGYHRCSQYNKNKHRQWNQNNTRSTKLFSSFVGIIVTLLTLTKIDCSNPHGSFEEKFCDVKARAIAKHNDKSTEVTTGTYKGEFQCDYDVTKIPEKEEELKGENYFLEQNKDYLFAQKTETKASGKYIGVLL